MGIIDWNTWLGLVFFSPKILIIYVPSCYNCSETWGSLYYTWALWQSRFVSRLDQGNCCPSQHTSTGLINNYSMAHVFSRALCASFVHFGYEMVLQSVSSEVLLIIDVIESSSGANQLTYSIGWVKWAYAAVWYRCLVYWVFSWPLVSVRHAYMHRFHHILSLVRRASHSFMSTSMSLPKLHRIHSKMHYHTPNYVQYSSSTSRRHSLPLPSSGLRRVAPRTP